MKAIRALALVALAALAACSDQNVTQRTYLDNMSPRYSLDCQLGADACIRISNAISTLESHGNSMCASLGADARARFNASGHGYRQGDGIEPYPLYVEMIPDFGSISGMGPANGNVYVNSGGTEVVNEILAGRLAHEETHQRGYDDPNHMMGVAYYWSETCQQSA